MRNLTIKGAIGDIGRWEDSGAHKCLAIKIKPMDESALGKSECWVERPFWGYTKGTAK